MASLRLTQQKVSLCHFLSTDTVLLKYRTWHRCHMQHITLAVHQFSCQPTDPSPIKKASALPSIDICHFSFSGF